MKNDLFDGLKAKIAGKNLKIVFPEGIEPRIIGAAYRLQAEELVTPILLGSVEEISATLRARGLQSSLFTIIDPADYDHFDEMVESFVARRAGKVTEEQARDILLDVNYFGTMLVYMGLADGLVSGAVHSTADTVRPALQIIKTKPGVSRTSGAFLMVRAYGKEKYIFSDCAINIKPGAQELAEIAIDSAATATLFDIEPRVAMLSFSTNGSGASEDVTKVVEATQIAKDLRPDLKIDGEMQFDAAFVPEVGRLKFPDSQVAGNASVFVFPDLQSGNIGYKIAQRIGNFEAIGPILQGLNKPVSDLSRGSNEEDVYKLSIITAAQALM